MSPLHLRLEIAFAMIVLSLCTVIIVDPVKMTNRMVRRPVAEPGDLYFTLAYRTLAIVGALLSLYILAGDLWTIAHQSR